MSKKLLIPTEIPPKILLLVGNPEVHTTAIRKISKGSNVEHITAISYNRIKRLPDISVVTILDTEGPLTQLHIKAIKESNFQERQFIIVCSYKNYEIISKLLGWK